MNRMLSLNSSNSLVRSSTISNKIIKSNKKISSNIASKVNKNSGNSILSKIRITSIDS